LKKLIAKKWSKLRKKSEEDLEKRRGLF